jgi:hypothetical protein
MTNSENQLLKELRILADELNKTPTIRDVRKRSDHSPQVYLDQFGSWNDAIKAAGLEPNQEHRLSKESLLAEIERLADETERPPTVQDLEDEGKYSRQAYRNHFGSWNNALEAAGFKSRSSTTKISTEELLAEIQRVADELGHPPSQSDIQEIGTYAPTQYYRRFKSWDDVLEAAGLEPIESSNTISREALLNEIRRLYDELGQPPTVQDVREHGKYSATPYYNHFEGFNEARTAAGLASPERKSHSTQQITKENLIDELCRLADELGHPPSLQEFRQHGEYSAGTYYNRFGSWQAALKEAGFVSRNPDSRITREELINELQSVAGKIGQSPSASQMNEHSDYWVSTYRNHFGTWTNALEAADFDVLDTSQISENELIEELQRLRNDLDRDPTKTDMRNIGVYQPDEYIKEFDSWSNAIDHIHKTENTEQ